MSSPNVIDEVVIIAKPDTPAQINWVAPPFPSGPASEGAMKVVNESNATAAAAVKVDPIPTTSAKSSLPPRRCRTSSLRSSSRQECLM